MSEPVTNEEIEDVLTAVRRLISESGTMLREAQGEAPSDDPTLGKLVLTPAFRVDMPESAEDAAPSGVDTLVQEAVAEEIGSVAEAAVAEALGTRPQSDGPSAISLEDRIAELEAVVDGDLPGRAEAAKDAGDPVADEAPEVAPAPFIEVVSDDEADELPEAVIFHTAGAGAFQSRRETSEPAASDAQDWEDVEELRPRFAGVSAAEASGAEVYDGDDDATPAYGEVDTSDDLVVDEDVLREIVGRLVREELQSTLGERITRNLRRMVRREIARALALKDVD